MRRYNTATQGQEGVKRITEAKKAGNPYALAFVDIRMPPGWDGVETIEHIWKIDQDIQVVICTAYSDYSWEETVEHLGLRENLLILKKPFDQIAVRQLAMALTKKWQLLQETRQHTQLLEKNIKERTKSLEESLSITRGTLESSVDAIIVINKEGQIIDFNKKLNEMWKIPSSIFDLKNGIHLLEYIANQFVEPKKFLDLVNKSMKDAEEIKADKLTRIDNSVIEFYSQTYALKNSEAGRIWSFRDITDRVLLEEKIQFQATHDILTELPNRELLNNFIREQISRATQTLTKFAVLFIDLDRFKLINDSFSHATGDELLKLVSNRIKTNVREGDAIARLGGDEFVMVITSFHTLNNLKKIAKKLIDVFEPSFKIFDHELIVSASIGVSIFPENGKTAEELLRNADMAMYQAKNLGGNQFQIYTEDMNLESIKKLEMEIDLHQAISNKEFFINYQPQYDIIKNKLISVEALIRWNHPQKGLLLPIDFIPLAEEIGLGPALTEWVLKTACKQNKIWQDKGFPPIRVAVNITTNVFKQPNFVSFVKNILNETGLKPEYLEIELTENIIVSSIEATNKIAQLKELGVSIAIDDFGTGYSSLNYLRKIPLDRLKIDQSFIKNIDINRGDEIIIQAIISMALNLNLEIVAEGVENQKQLDFLKSKRCSEIQGFYYSKPLSPDQLEDLLMHPEKIVIERS